MSFFHSSTKKSLFTVQFGSWHIASYKTCILFKSSGVVLLEYIHSLEVLFFLSNLDVSLQKIKSHSLYILCGWQLNEWVKRWFTGTTLSTTSQKNAYILCVQDATTFILNCVLKTVLCTTKWLTYNQYKKYVRLYKVGIWRLWLMLNQNAQLTCMVNAKSFLANSIQNRFIKVYNRGRNWYISLNEMFLFEWNVFVIQFTIIFSFRNHIIPWRK